MLYKKIYPQRTYWMLNGHLNTCYFNYSHVYVEYYTRVIEPLQLRKQKLIQDMPLPRLYSK